MKKKEPKCSTPSSKLQIQMSTYVCVCIHVSIKYKKLRGGGLNFYTHKTRHYDNKKARKIGRDWCKFGAKHQANMTLKIVRIWCNVKKCIDMLE